MNLLKKIGEWGKANPLKGALGVLAAIAFLGVAGNICAESKQAEGTTLSTMIWGPRLNGITVTSVDAISDKPVARITFKARTINPLSTAYYKINGAGTTSQAVIPLEATTGLASNDTVLVSGKFTSYQGTLVAVSATTVTLSANLTTAVADGDRLDELTTIYTLDASLVSGSNQVNRLGGTIVKTPPNSPLVVTQDGTSTNKISVTTSD